MKDLNNFEDILNELRIIMVRKHQDYGPFNRLENLYYKSSDTPNYESIEDTFIDLANYAIIGLLVQRRQWEGVAEG